MLSTRLLTKKLKKDKAEDKRTAKTVQSRIHPHSVLVTNHGISGNRKEVPIVLAKGRTEP